MSDNRELFLTKVAYMYYNDELPQKEIAKLLSISRPTVSRAIQEAKEKGIVKIEITTSTFHQFDFEKQLREKFNLEGVVVVPNIAQTDHGLKRQLGEAAASYLYEHLRDGMILGMSMGTTIKAVVDAIDYDHTIRCDVVPILGGVGNIDSDLHANELCRRIAKKVGGEVYPLYVPAVAAGEFEREIFLKDEMVQQVFEKVEHANYVLISAGHLETSTFLNIGAVTKEEAEEMKTKGAIGDIGNWFVDQEGRSVDVSFHRRLVGPSIFDLKSKTKLVFVAGGELKHEAVRAALRGGIPDIVITDEATAEYLLTNV